MHWVENIKIMALDEKYIVTDNWIKSCRNSPLSIGFDSFTRLVLLQSDLHQFLSQAPPELIKQWKCQWSSYCIYLSTEQWGEEIRVAIPTFSNYISCFGLYGKKWLLKRFAARVMEGNDWLKWLKSKWKPGGGSGRRDGIDEQRET